MKLTTTVKAPVLDMFSRDWEFEGKKGTAHFVVIYDYDNHTSERLVIDSANDKCYITFRTKGRSGSQSVKVVIIVKGSK